MSLENLLARGRLKEHKTSIKEITDLLKVVERDIADASIKELSSDRCFATAYNAVLQLATIALYCKGYRPTGTGHHFTVFQTLKHTLGEEGQDLADYFDACRVKRNMTDYDRAGQVPDKEAKELLNEAMIFKRKINDWLLKNYPNFLR